MQKKLKGFKDFLKNIQYRIYKYSVEETTQVIKPTIGSRKVKITIYSKIHKNSNWLREYSFYLTYKSDIELTTIISKTIENIKAFYQWLEENDFSEYPMCSYKNLMTTIVDFDFTRKKLVLKVIDNNISNYLPIKSPTISVNILTDFHKIVLYRNNELKILGNSYYVNGKHFLFRSKVALEKALADFSSTTVS